MDEPVISTRSAVCAWALATRVMASKAAWAMGLKAGAKAGMGSL